MLTRLFVKRGVLNDVFVSIRMSPNINYNYSLT